MNNGTKPWTTVCRKRPEDGIEKGDMVRFDFVPLDKGYYQGPSFGFGYQIHGCLLQFYK